MELSCFRYFNVIFDYILSDYDHCPCHNVVRTDNKKGNTKQLITTGCKYSVDVVRLTSLSFCLAFLVLLPNKVDTKQLVTTGCKYSVEVVLMSSLSFFVLPGKRQKRQPVMVLLLVTIGCNYKYSVDVVLMSSMSFSCLAWKKAPYSICCW